MKNCFKKSLQIVFSFAFFSFPFLSISAQDNTGDSAYIFEDFESPVFVEIHLDKGQITAIDSMGYDWYYDFDKDAFVIGYYPDFESAEENQVVDQIIPVYERCTNKKNVKDFEESIIVGYDEYVDGDVKAFERVSIKGWVRGDVTSINDSVIIFQSGQVDGDVKAPWVIQKKGSKVRGKIIIKDKSLDLKDITGSFSADGLVVAIVFTVMLILFSFIVINLMPIQLNRMNEIVFNNPVKTYLLGFLFIIIMPIIMAVISITIVGIIFALLVPLLYLIAFFMGVVILGNKIGRIISIKFFGSEKKMLFQSTIGIFSFMSLWLLDAVLMGQQNDVAEGFGIFVMVVAIIISTFPVCTGVGSALLTRFGFRDYKSWKEKHGFGEVPPVPAPPPLREQNNNNSNIKPSTNNPEKPDSPNISDESF